MVAVELEPIGFETTAWLGGYTGRGGLFEIKDVPPGKYRLATSSNQARVTHPEPKVHYAAGSSEPLELELACDTKIEGLVWQLPPWGKRRRCLLSAINAQGDPLRIVGIENQGEGGGPIANHNGIGNDPIIFEMYDGVYYRFIVRAIRDFQAEALAVSFAQVRARNPELTYMTYVQIPQGLPPPIHYLDQTIDLPPGPKPAELKLVFTDAPAYPPK